MKITPPPEGKIGAEITDVDVRSLTADDAQVLRDCIYKHKLAVFRDQHDLTNEEYIKFAGLIGRVQIYFQENYHHPKHPEIFVSTNVPDENGNKIGVAGTGQYWHTDYQFDENPLSFTLLYPKILPRGNRETYYIDMEHVYHEMPDDLRQCIGNRDAIHEAKWRYKVTPEDVDKALIDVLEEAEKLIPMRRHPAIIQHPVSGKKAYYISSGFTTGLEGYSHSENTEIMPKLFDFIEQDEHIHTHRWNLGDILFWDNRLLLHKASKTPKGEQSRSYRIGVYDDHPFYIKAN